MSTKLLNLAWDVDLPLSRKMVLIALADQANDKGECFPGIESLRRRCSMGLRTVYEAIAELEGDDYLARHQKPGRPTLYALNLEKLAQRDLLDTRAPAAGVREPQGCATRRGGGANAAGVRQSQGCAKPQSGGAAAAPYKSNQEAKATYEGDTRARAVDPEPTGDQVAQMLDREDQFNRLSDLDQRLIEPYLERLPLGVSLHVFARYVRHVQVHRRSLSISSWMSIAARLVELRAAGHDLDKALEFTMRRQWVDPEPEPGGKPRAAPRNSVNGNFESASYASTSDDELPDELRSDDHDDRDG